MTFGMVIAAHTGSKRLNLCFASCFGFLVIGSNFSMQIYLYGKGRHIHLYSGNVLMTFLQNRGALSSELWCGNSS